MGYKANLIRNNNNVGYNKIDRNKWRLNSRVEKEAHCFGPLVVACDCLYDLCSIVLYSTPMTMMMMMKAWGSNVL